MNPLAKVLILALAGAGTWVAAAGPGSAALHNQNDRIWEAFSAQANVELEGKYKESPENGLIEQELRAELEDVAPGTRVTFLVDGRAVRTVTADNSGEARMEIRMVVQAGPDGRPTGPRVNDGSILTAMSGNRTLSATFVRVQ